VIVSPITALMAIGTGQEDYDQADLGKGKAAVAIGRRGRAGH
jgi:hypothetical protein